jgi:hypothetical protein
LQELAQAGVDVINPSGAPPFMVLGYGQERTLIRAWVKKYRTGIFHLRHQSYRCAARP